MAYWAKYMGVGLMTLVAAGCGGALADPPPSTVAAEIQVNHDIREDAREDVAEPAVAPPSTRPQTRLEALIATLTADKTTDRVAQLLERTFPDYVASRDAAHHRTWILTARAAEHQRFIVAFVDSQIWFFNDANGIGTCHYVQLDTLDAESLPIEIAAAYRQLLAAQQF